MEAGFDVDVATKDSAIVFGKYGVPARATIATTDLDADRYDMVLLPGPLLPPLTLQQPFADNPLNDRLLHAIADTPLIQGQSALPHKHQFLVR